VNAKVLFVRQLMSQSGSGMSLGIKTLQRLQLILCNARTNVTAQDASGHCPFLIEADTTQRLTQRDTLADEGPEGPREGQKPYCHPAKQR
jgi:hypothetical protein